MKGEIFIFKKFTVIKEYTSCYPDPILLKKDEEILYGREDTQYPNWIFCKSINSNKEGWVPNQILSPPEGSKRAKVLKDYSAHELTVIPGDILHGLEQLNNWTFCKTKTGELGWIPTDHLSSI